MDTGEFWTHEVVTPAAKFIGTKQSSCAITMLDIDANSEDQAQKTQPRDFDDDEQSRTQYTTNLSTSTLK